MLNVVYLRVKICRTTAKLSVIVSFVIIQTFEERKGNHVHSIVSPKKERLKNILPQIM